MFRSPRDPFVQAELAYRRAEAFGAAVGRLHAPLRGLRHPGRPVGRWVRAGVRSLVPGFAQLVGGRRVSADIVPFGRRAATDDAPAACAVGAEASEQSWLPPGA